MQLTRLGLNLAGLIQLKIEIGTDVEAKSKSKFVRVEYERVK